jgi:plastocyanin
MNKLLFGLFGCMLLTILFSACSIVDASTLPKNPKALMGASLFITTDITVKKGQSLDLVDTVSNPHVIANGFYDASGKVEKPSESGAPQIGTINFSGNDTQTIGPFNTAGDFHYYCTIHPNMNLLVHVTA